MNVQRGRVLLSERVMVELSMVDRRRRFCPLYCGRCLGILSYAMSVVIVEACKSLGRGRLDDVEMNPQNNFWSNAMS